MGGNHSEPDLGSSHWLAFGVNKPSLDRVVGHRTQLDGIARNFVGDLDEINTGAFNSGNEKMGAVFCFFR